MVGFWAAVPLYAQQQSCDGCDGVRGLQRTRNLERDRQELQGCVQCLLKEILPSFNLSPLHCSKAARENRSGQLSESTFPSLSR